MQFLRIAVALAFCSFGYSFGQEVNGEAFVVSQALGNAHVNGSLSYWGRKPCTFSPHELYPVLPAVVNVDKSGSIQEILQKMFAGDPKMQVTQESTGTVRMIETDVPMDLLKIKIHHISFDMPGIHGPNMAIRIILSSPEVKTFRREHNIGPFSDLYIVPSDAGPSYPSVSGSLDDVTVSEALDYLLKTYSGFWMYGNCSNGSKDVERDIYFWFYKAAPVSK